MKNTDGLNEDILTKHLLKLNEIEEGAIVYTSGIDGIISPAIPVGKIKITDDVKYVEFFVNYNQLKLIRVNN